MSKDIWHTTDEVPESYADIAFYVDGYLYFSSYQPQYNQYGIFGADKVEKWCYIKELSPYILALETELERTRKALDVARNGLEYIFGYEGVPKYVVKHIRQVLDQIKNETALEQKDVK